MVRRSGKPIGAGMVGLYTAAGWQWARDIGAGVAVQRAREIAPLILAETPRPQNDTPDVLLDLLQTATLDHWTDWLADLRVRPFSDRDSAVLISGALSRRNSPLDALFRDVWVQVGGADRLRPHTFQLRIATVLGPTIQYVEQGRLREISALFSSLNVALGSIDLDEERGIERLMSVQDRARSIAALKAAPPLVVQITEDVLAQTSAAHSDQLSNPVTQRWQRNVYPVCRATVEGRYPFHDGADVEISDFATLLGPQGALARFFTSTVGRYVDTEAERWRW